MGFPRLAALGAALALAGCGVIYTAPYVSDGSSSGMTGNTDFDVQVVELGAETVRTANLSTYVPPRLPLAFQPDAVAEIVAEAPGTPDLAPLPDPTVPSARRPTGIPDRFPPLGEPRPYRIGVSDVLLLSVSASATSIEALPGLLSAQAKREGYVVQDDGAIAIPDAGRVQVAGRTLEEAEAEIFQVLVDAGIDPAFSLEIAEFNSRRVTVAGEVAQPTLVPIGLKTLYLHEAVELAGGVVAPDPSVAVVQLFRNGETYQIGLERFRTDPDARRIVLRDGDVVYVGSEYRQRLAQTRFEQELALRRQQVQNTEFEIRREELEETRRNAAQRRLDARREIFKDRLELGAVARPAVYLAGEVRETRRLELPFEGTASLADLMFDEVRLDIRTADYSNIYVLRPETDPDLAGGLTAYRLDAENAANLAVAAQFEMRPNDVVFVAEQPVTSWNRVISQILPNIFLRAATIADG